LGDARQLADFFPIVIRSRAVPHDVTAFLAHMLNAGSLFLVILNSHRSHKPLAFRKPITGNILVNMQTKKAKAAMIAAASPIMRRNFHIALLALEPLIGLNHVFTEMHLLSGR
jgi:hypothetical protein